MTTKSKQVRGQLLDLSNKNLLADVSVDVSLIQPQNPNDRAKYKATMTVNGYKPELDNKTHVLRLSEIISGEVFTTIKGIPSKTKTQFTVFFQDARWNDLKWFELL